MIYLKDIVGGFCRWIFLRVCHQQDYPVWFFKHLVFTVIFCNQGKGEIRLCWVKVVRLLEHSFYLHKSFAHDYCFARLGGVHFIVHHIQICNRLLQSELFQVTLFTAHISPNGSHFFDG